MPDPSNAVAAIPEDKRPAVNRALETAFGTTAIDQISVPTGGLSTALIFRLVVQGKPYLLRVIMSADVTRHLTRWLVPMQAAAEAGVAPRTHYASIEDGVLITDFVQSHPYPPDMALQLAPVLHTLHSLPGFPPMSTSMSYQDFVNGSVRKVQEAHLLPDAETADLFRRYARLSDSYPFGDPDLVASHNDLKPQNILFDGQRAWLVDWEAAFLNHRYSDLSIVANFFVGDAVSEDAYLAAYFGRPPTEVQRARYFLVSQTIHMSYLTVFLLMAQRAGASIDLAAPPPDFRAFHQHLIANEADVLTTPSQLGYARIHLEALRRDLSSPRFDESLAQVGGT